MKSKIIGLIAMAILGCVACEEKPTPGQPSIQYMSFYSRSQTIDVESTTTIGKVEISSEIDLLGMKTNPDRFVPVEIFDNESSAKLGIHYNLKNGTDLFLSRDDYKHLSFEIIPENITEEVSFLLYCDRFANLPNPNNKTIFDLVKITLTPKKVE